MIAITCEDQSGRDDVMYEHVPVILSPFFNVYDEDLLKPEGILDENVPLPKAWNLTIWPIRP